MEDKEHLKQDRAERLIELRDDAYNSCWLAANVFGIGPIGAKLPDLKEKS